MSDDKSPAAENARLSARIRELEAQVAEGVKIKPLDWSATVISGRHLRDIAIGLEGLIAYEAGVEENYLLVNWRGLRIKRLGIFDTLEAAKAAAQADYEARIRSALTLTPHGT